MRDFAMSFSQLTVQFPRLAAELAQRSGSDLDEAVRRIVEGAMAATGLEVTNRSPKEVEHLVWSLDDVAWGLQEQVESGKTSPALYSHAFRKARAASALLGMLEGRYGEAVYEAVQALSSDEEAAVQLLGA
ncbi:MAG: hypothetical protein ACLQVK_06265 [Acidimicrobiales bacterium]